MRSLLRWILPVLVLAGCEGLAFVDRSHIGGAGGGGSASTSGGAGGTGGHGGTAGIQCILPLDCPGQDTDCRVRTCVAGACGFSSVAEGTPTTGQVPGDCQQRVCDGAGSVKQVGDGADPLDDHNPCTADLCVNDSPINTPYVTAACGVAGEGVCDGQGRCVACVTSASCAAGTLCMDNHCVPPSCLDHQRDSDETAVDCGGSACAPCGAGQGCLRHRDCQSGVCGAQSNLCQAPSCADGVRNGDETGVDCGGSCAKRCGPGQGCQVGEDCLGQVCSGAVCLPSCHDGVKDGAETGIDCGGHACGPCAPGAGCGLDGDCQSGVCQSNVCVPPGCVDGVREGAESDVDCGGPCAPCAPGAGCAQGSDCTSRVCAGTLCATPTCTDHVRNGGETGVDCGGPTCGKCPDTGGCQGPADCQSGVCAAGACVQAGCTDGVKDLTETDVDCGGGACPGCAYGRVCVSAGDCASLGCVQGKCTQATCDDGLANGDESDQDCGGSCIPCQLGKGCHTFADCASVACAGSTCVPPACDDGVRNGQETGTDCGGPTCSKCAGGEGCTGAADCASAVCDAGTCAASCNDNLHDGDETGVDCGGSCGGCPTGGPCVLDADCDSQVCAGATCAPPSCTDGVKNGTETDTDCGGPACGGCVNGSTCQKPPDCLSRGCLSGVCDEVVLISEVRTNGVHNGTLDDSYADDFIELYNPGNAPIVLDSTWVLWHKSAQGICQGKEYRYKGIGVVLPSHRHLLLVGLAYAGPPADAILDGVMPGDSIADAASLWIEHGGKVVEAICYYYDDVTLGRINGNCPFPYICKGTPISNLPHNGGLGPTSSVDVSLERKPGAAGGNYQDTGDTATDFIHTMPANPQNLSSPPTP
jgi:hypothetical protein